MLHLSPSAHFKNSQKSASEELHKAARTSWMACALTCAMAEMAYGKATSDQLVGARMFVETFMNMAEDVTLPPEPPPSKELQPIPGMTKPTAEKQEKK